MISPRKHQYYPFCCNIIALIVNNILQSSYLNQTTSLVSDTASFLTALMEKNGRFTRPSFWPPFKIFGVPPKKAPPFLTPP
ncbi:hypothetical protein KCA24_36805, partial [Escherichia coli]|nr:hypothetical protein [Escherichia coli]